MLNSILLIVLLIGAVSPVHAHDPGLSRASVQADAQGMTIRMVFARNDIDALLALDTDLDGSVTDHEIYTARIRLQSALSAGIELRGAGTLLRPKSVRVEAGPDNTLNVGLFYDRPAAAATRLSVPLIRQLARGHRQYLTVQDTNNKPLAQYILDSATAQISLREVDPEYRS